VKYLLLGDLLAGNSHETSTALENLRTELSIITQKDIANLGTGLKTFNSELVSVQKKEVEHSSENLSNFAIDIEKIHKREFSLLRTLGIEENELVHSNFLAYLLDPAENHGLGSQFIEKFLRVAASKSNRDAIRIPSIDFQNILVEREISSETSRSDIRLMDVKGLFHCTIENKIFSREGDEQTNRLYRDFHGICPSELFVFLTLSGKEKPTNRNFISVTYSELLPALHELLNDAVGDTKLLMKNYLSTLERLILAEKFNGYSERTQLYFRYVKEINEVKSAYEEDRKLLLSALEEGVKERSWWDESVWKMKKTGSDVLIYKPEWWPEEAGVYLWIRPWIEGPACDLYLYGTPAAFSTKFVHVLKKYLEPKYTGKMAGDFIAHLTGVNTFLERTIKFSLTEKEQVEKILKVLDEMVNQLGRIIDESIAEFNRK
jgi:hypothetical protein